MKRLMHSIAMALLLSILAPNANAQVINYKQTTIASQAQVVNKKALTLEGARSIIASAIAAAKQKNSPGGAIAVVDEGGNLIALERLDNTFGAAATVSIGKARTAAIFKHPTKFFEDAIKNGRTSLVAMPDFTPLQGGVLIEVDGQVIGAVGVSGASSAQQDEEIAIAGANGLNSSVGQR
ncbi:heme-binding protein [Kovacikia minuta CCNUW1]|uniref:GlcG/HbpS family heme-binding protein n=1 Tax=Kovacikia minuta TaxID=2931930 RepID=UPI001CC97642|nr:heme-binding protein [Kovacikia minuta]UBF24311.1 heme-binding protein [Kovacikia minuta CCNUW1]